MDSTFQGINPYPAELIYLNFQPIEVVSRYRDPQPKVVENYLYFFNLRPYIYKSWYLNSHFIPNNNCFNWLIKLIENDYCRD